MLNAEEMTVEQLRHLKAEWYHTADGAGILWRIADVARAFGDDPVRLDNPGTYYRSSYGPKYRYTVGSGDTAIIVYVDDYGHYMTVHEGARLVCSTHDTNRLYIPGEWANILLAQAKRAEEQLAAEENDTNERERRALLQELGL